MANDEEERTIQRDRKRRKVMKTRGNLRKRLPHLTKYKSGVLLAMIELKREICNYKTIAGHIFPNKKKYSSGVKNLKNCVNGVGLQLRQLVQMGYIERNSPGNYLLKEEIDYSIIYENLNIQNCSNSIETILKNDDNLNEEEEEEGMKESKKKKKKKKKKIELLIKSPDGKKLNNNGVKKRLENHEEYGFSSKNYKSSNIDEKINSQELNTIHENVLTQLDLVLKQQQQQQQQSPKEIEVKQTNTIPKEKINEFSSREKGIDLKMKQFQGLYSEKVKKLEDQVEEKNYKIVLKKNKKNKNKNNTSPHEGGRCHENHFYISSKKKKKKKNKNKNYQYPSMLVVESINCDNDDCRKNLYYCFDCSNFKCFHMMYPEGDCCVNCASKNWIPREEEEEEENFVTVPKKKKKKKKKKFGSNPRNNDFRDSLLKEIIDL